MKTENNNTSDFFLPDFCGLNSVFAVVILSELFALILTLAATPYRFDPWGQLALTSLFMQWAGLSSAGLLCATRRQLARLQPVAAGITSYMMLLVVILLLSEVSFHIIRDTGRPLWGIYHLEFLLRNLAIGAIVSALALRYLYVQHQWKQRIRAEAEARLQALQARIRPHFLFNSINTVTSLIHDKPDMAEEALLDLSDLFRASMREEKRRIPFSEELELTRRYLHMESLRLGDRLRVEWHVGDVPEDAMLPPLMLQPLVENAVYHGIEPNREGGTITLSGTVDGERLILELNNPLPGSDVPRKNGNRLALNNIRDRLEAHYGRNASLEVEEGDGSYCATLTLPLELSQ